MRIMIYHNSQANTVCSTLTDMNYNIKVSCMGDSLVVISLPNDSAWNALADLSDRFFIDGLQINNANKDDVIVKFNGLINR